MITIEPQVFVVGTRRPVTHAVIVDGAFICYASCPCQARKAIAMMRKRWLTMALVLTVVAHVARAAFARNERRWRG